MVRVDYLPWFASTIRRGLRRLFAVAAILGQVNTYAPRIVDDELARALRLSPAVAVTGLRACGKTTTALQHARSSEVLDESRQDALAAVRLSPQMALDGEEPRLIDEWQLVPELWGAVRRGADEDSRPGRFILSGSAWPEDDARRHPGAGRIVSVRMRTMSLQESGDSTGEFSLDAAFAGESVECGPSPITPEQAAGLIVRGGFPAWIQHAPDDAQYLVRNYLDALSIHDFPLVGGTRRAPERFRNFVQAYASLTAHPSPLSTLGKRLGEDGIDVGKDFAGLFHNFAERMFIVEDQPAWSPQRRSRTRLVATPKRHLVDPALAAAALGMGQEGLLRDPETLGFLFESLVVRDLRIYAQRMDATVFHYRTKDATAEMDAVVERRDGSWIGVEVKLGIPAAQEASERLLQIASTIDRPPAALIVIVPGGPATRLPNGVWLVPVGLLGP